jgi:hypothetical protein
MSEQVSRSQFEGSFDAATQLKDPGAVTATGNATVAAVARVLDFGTAAGRIAHTMGWLVVDVAAIDGTTGDEAYSIEVQLAADVAFTTGVVTKCAVLMGDQTASGAPDDYATGRIKVGVDNEHKGTLKRFMRLRHVLAGTTPSINYQAYLSKM